MQSLLGRSRWSADALYGSDSRLRRMLEQRGQPYVQAVRSNHHLRFLVSDGLVQTDPSTLADALDAAAWATHAAGEGAKGLRLYDWARIALPWICDADRERWLLIRRSRSDPAKRAHYFVLAPAGTPLAELAGAAGLRWTTEDCFQRAKGDLGFDHCETRSWHGWHGHMSLCKTTRRVRKPLVSMVPSRMLGSFRDDPTIRRELLAMIGTPRSAPRRS